MPPNLEERRPAITPQLAVRVAVLGGFAFVLFAVIFFRLWFLQVLSGEDYVTQARENRVRKIKIEAPRGDIVDRDGNRLVRTRVAPVVQIVPSGLPEAELKVADGLPRRAQRRRAAPARRRRPAARARAPAPGGGAPLHAAPSAASTAGWRAPRAAPSPSPCRRCPPTRAQLRRSFRRLGRVLDMSPRTIQRRVIEGIAEAPYSNVTVKTDVSRAAFNYLKERKDEFPGVAVEKLFLRSYPHDELAAQLFGTLREISPDELKSKKLPRRRRGHAHRQGRHRGDLRPLPARPGRLHARRHQRARQPRRPPRGHAPRAPAGPAPAPDARPRPPARRQQRAQAARSRPPTATATPPRRAPTWRWTRPTARCWRSAPTRASTPTCSPSRCRRRRSTSSTRRRTARRCSTARSPRPIRPARRSSRSPRWPRWRRASSRPRRRSSTTASSSSARRSSATPRNARYGSLAMPRALQVSSDVFFYTLGERANSRGPIIQRWARRLGLGRPTGIDIPGEFDGLVPDRRWRDAGYAKYRKCVKREKVPAVRRRRAAEVRRHRAPVVHGRQRQPLRRPGRPAGDAAADGRRLLGDRQRRHAWCARTWR